MWLSIFNSSKFKLLVSIWYCDMICRSWLQWGWLLLASRAKIPIAESDSMALFVQISVQRKVINHTFSITFVWTHAHSIHWHWHSLIHPWWWKYCRHLPHSPHSAPIEMCCLLFTCSQAGPGHTVQVTGSRQQCTSPGTTGMCCWVSCVLGWSLVTGAGAETEMTNRTWWRT